MLAAVGVLSIGALAAWTIGSSKLQTLETKSADLAAQYREMLPGRNRFKRDVLKTQHLKHWQEADVDWLEHLLHLGTVSPPPDQLVLDSWTGVLNFRGVSYDPDQKTSRQKWQTPMPIKIVLDGEAKDRMTADAFRAALVRGKLYTLTSAGPDSAGGRRLPYKFNYRLGSAANAQPIEDDATSSNQASAADPPVGTAVAHNVARGNDS